MALMKKQDKDQNGKKPAKKIMPKTEKKAVVVKKDAVNRLDSIKKYFRGVYSELKKVHWPTRREVITYTAVVVVAVIFVGALIWIFDWLLSRAIQLIIR